MMDILPDLVSDNESCSDWDDDMESPSCHYPYIVSYPMTHEKKITQQNNLGKIITEVICKTLHIEESQYVESQCKRYSLSLDKLVEWAVAMNHCHGNKEVMDPLFNIIASGKPTGISKDEILKMKGKLEHFIKGNYVNIIGEATA
ncbi:hypothetical protein DAMA08_035960 [Martiniozyma asiatica (nom. inval.)]|nr:hypothetical protein DAMA08_035960 [Martiniozyma asiatica]